MESNVKVVLTSDPTVAQTLTESNDPPKVTIEAEYGQYVAVGSEYTAAHHQPTGPYSNENPSPCCDTNIPLLEEGAILVSHIDLDTIGGCLRAMKGYEELFQKSNESFWRFAGYVDLNGPHKMHLGAVATHPEQKQDLINQITAFWAWDLDNNPKTRTGQGESLDVTDVITNSGNTLMHIMRKNPEYIQQGIDFQSKEAILSEESFRDVQTIGNQDNQAITVLMRNSDQFTNHLYTYENGKMADIVIAFRPNLESITLSYAQWEGRKMDKLIAPAYEIMQSIWGNTAGGHAAIAGTPRELQVKETAIAEVLAEVDKYRASHLYELNVNRSESDIFNEVPF